jgi:hypothetical protein
MLPDIVCHVKATRSLREGSRPPGVSPVREDRRAIARGVSLGHGVLGRAAASAGRSTSAIV